MLPAPSTPFVAGVGSVIVAAAFLAFGLVLVDAVLGRLRLDHWVRWGLAFPAATAFALAVALVHVVTGGRVLSSPWLTRALTGAVLVAVLVWRYRGRQGGRIGSDEDAREQRERWLPPLLLLATLAMWGTPVFRMFALDHTGDTNMHMGWASQLLNGEPLPSAPITGQVPNYYPWLYHALVAFVSHFTPGGRAFHVLAPLQLLQASGGVLALYGIGRQVAGRWTAGAAAALFGGLSGGVGFVLLRGLDVVVEPRAEGGTAGLRYLGDLVLRRSYHGAFANLAPPFPRDVALSLMLGFLLLLAVAMARKSLPLLVAAGSVLGLTGLAGGEAFFLGMGVAAMLIVAPDGMPRLRTAAAVFGPALAVYALWAAPMAVHYVRLGGFVNITRVPPVNLTPLAVFGAWGVATPLALYGAFRWLPRVRQDPGARLVLAVVVVAGAAVLLSVALPAVLGEAFLTLGRRHRYWPLLHLGVALYAALGLSELLARASAVRRGLAAGIAMAVVAVAIPSPVVASLALPRAIGRARVLDTALAGRPSALLSVMAPQLGRRCSAAVPVGQDVRVFSYTGYRMVAFVWSELYTANRARIRWRGIYERIPADPERLRDNRLLTEGLASPQEWRAVAARYGVDLVVVPADRAGAEAFRGIAREPVRETRFALFRLGTCQT